MKRQHYQNIRKFREETNSYKTILMLCPKNSIISKKISSIINELNQKKSLQRKNSTKAIRMSESPYNQKIDYLSENLSKNNSFSIVRYLGNNNYDSKIESKIINKSELNSNFFNSFYGNNLNSSLSKTSQIYDEFFKTYSKLNSNTENKNRDGLRKGTNSLYMRNSNLKMNRIFYDKIDTKSVQANDGNKKRDMLFNFQKLIKSHNENKIFYLSNSYLNNTKNVIKKSSFLKVGKCTMHDLNAFNFNIIKESKINNILLSSRTKIGAKKNNERECLSNQSRKRKEPDLFNNQILASAICYRKLRECRLFKNS